MGVALFLFKHIQLVVECVLAGAACLVFLQSIGCLLLARKRVDDSWRTARPAVVGAAITILCCSYGLQLNVALPQLFLALVCLLASPTDADRCKSGPLFFCASAEPASRKPNGGHQQEARKRQPPEQPTRRAVAPSTDPLHGRRASHRRR